MILPGYMRCRKRAGSTLHWVAGLDGTTECLYSTCCTGTDHATFRLGWTMYIQYRSYLKFLRKKRMKLKYWNKDWSCPFHLSAKFSLTSRVTFVYKKLKLAWWNTGGPTKYLKFKEFDIVLFSRLLFLFSYSIYSILIFDGFEKFEI